MGIAFRDSILANLQAHPAYWAQIWGCAEEAVQATATEWCTQWADARALLTLACAHQATVVVFNKQDNLIETKVGEGLPYVGRVLVLEFEGGHYNPLPQMLPEQLQKIQQATPLQPWKVQPGYLRGGAKVYARLGMKFCLGLTAKMMSPALRKLETLRAGQVEVKRERTPRDAQSLSEIVSWNIGGVRANIEQLEQYLRHNRPAIVGLQELRLAQEHQGSFQRRMRRCGYCAVFGQATPWAQDRKKRLRLATGDGPGMGFLYQEGYTIYPRQLVTQAAKEAYQLGRLMMIEIETLHAPTFILGQVYLHAGSHAEHQRSIYQDMLLEEIGRQGTQRMMLMGDCNEHPEKAKLLLKLKRNHGWRIPYLTEGGGREAMATDSTLAAGLIYSALALRSSLRFGIRKWTLKRSLPIVVSVLNVS